MFSKSTHSTQITINTKLNYILSVLFTQPINIKFEENIHLYFIVLVPIFKYNEYYIKQFNFGRTKLQNTHPIWILVIV